MTESMRIMTQNPLNAETQAARLRSWITPNAVFFDRNQGKIPEAPIALDKWALTVDGEVKKKLNLGLEQIQRLPKAIVANTLECSGNSRSLLKKKASGNPWTIGGVGNAVWGGVWLRDLLNDAGLTMRGRQTGPPMSRLKEWTPPSVRPRLNSCAASPLKRRCHPPCWLMK